MAEAGLAAAAAAVELAKAQLAQAEAALAFRMTEADRSIALFDRGAIPRHQLDFVLLERDTAAAMVDSARATAAMRERERDSAAAVLDPFGIGGEQTCCVPVTAPVSGRVLQVLTEDDQIVEPGTPILVIGDPGDLVLRVDLLSRDAVRVRPGLPRGSLVGAAPTLLPRSSRSNRPPSPAHRPWASMSSGSRFCCA
ncbi:HlyD family efflux transporter periplasmic adaptor subunit [Gemmobacter lanyuensis]